MGKKKSRLRAGVAVVDPAVPFGRPVTTAEADRLGRFPVHGLIALCEMGCGGEDCLVTAGIERGWVWSHMVGGRYRPAYPHAPVYPEGSTATDRARMNEEFDAALLAPSNTVRLGFWAWYRQWLESMARDAKRGAGAGRGHDGVAR